jgi:hypothetical protein
VSLVHGYAKGGESGEINGKRNRRKIVQYKYYVSQHYPSSCFYLKHSVSETGFCLRLNVKTTQLGPSDRASPYLPRSGDKIQSPKSYVLNKNRTIFNVQKYNIYINVPSSQHFRSYLEKLFFFLLPRNLHIFRCCRGISKPRF